jgi:peptidyl-prolyl cis-trans isomerase D
MAGSGNDRQKLFSRIFLGAVVLVLAGGMLLYLVPSMPGNGGDAPADAVATVGDQNITSTEIMQRLNEVEQRNPTPYAKMLEPTYIRQILNEFLVQKEIEYEAKRLGIHVSDQERADRIRQLLPMAYNGDTFIGNDRYAAAVQERTQMTVPAFEEAIRQSLLVQKFQKLVTDGISVGPTEIQDEFQYRNQKIKVDYALIKPEDLAAKVTPTEDEIKVAYDKNRAKYMVPEKRVVRYALVDANQVRQNTQVSDDDLKAQYQRDIQQYQVPNRVHVEHILLMTVSKTDAEIAEIRQKAEDILKQAKKPGAKFEDLAKKYSEDPGTKDKGGDLGWVTQGQTVKEFETTAFTLPKGSISDLVKTEYGFHIIKVLDKETAHTKPFEEVKDSIRAPLLLSKADQQAGSIADKLSTTIRQNSKVTLDDLAKQYHLSVGETRPVSANDPIIELGNSKEVKDAVFGQRVGELSLPIHTERGYIILTIKEQQASHQGTLAEVRDRIVADLKQQKGAELAQQKSADLEKRLKGGEKFEAAAKSLGLETKTSDFFARNGSISGAASGKQLSAAFQMKAGDVGMPLNLGQNWLVYRVTEKQEPNPADFDKQKKELTDQVLQSKRSAAYAAFQTSLEARLRQEGKLKIMPEKIKALTGGNGINL